MTEIKPEDFTMYWDDQHTFPFIEDEDANITGYGHQDKAELAAAINRYDELCNGGPLRPEERWTADDIGHYWVTQRGERLHKCSADTPEAFPVTGLWGQR